MHFLNILCFPILGDNYVAGKQSKELDQLMVALHKGMGH